MNAGGLWYRSVKTCRTWVASLAACVLVAAGVVIAAPPAAAKVCDGSSVPCTIGDTGPGGGIVFYDAGGRQPWGRYLEVAPAGWATGQPVYPPTSQPAYPPTAPRQVKVTVRQGGATVSWQSPVDASGQLRYVVTTEPSSKGCRTSKKSCSVSGLVPGRQYEFSVMAMNEAGEGEAGTARARVPARPQPAPSQKPVPVYRSGPTILPLSVDPIVPWCKNDREGHSRSLPTSTAIGTGRANTEIIIQACGPDSAAGVVAAYRGGGKADWFLPSKDELNALLRQKGVVGALAWDNFWSSSQDSDRAYNAWYQSFGYGLQYDGTKVVDYRVRPVRAF